MASNHNYVCFECRVAVRRPKRTTPPPCPQCRQTCRNIGYKVAVPPKADAAEWQRLFVTIGKWEREAVVLKRRHRAAEIRQLECRIEELSALPANPGRAGLIRRIRKTLEERRGIPDDGTFDRTW